MRNIITKEILNNMISDYNNGLGLDELSQKYKFKKQSIRKNLTETGIVIKSKVNRFSKTELDEIISDYKNGMPPYELGNKYGRKPSVIISKLKSIGIYKNSTYHVTNDDIEFLKKNYPIGNWDSIFKRFPNVSKESIYTKMSKLNISQENYYWSNEEETILKDNYYLLNGNIEELSKLFDNKFSHSAISSKAKKLGLKSREFWTEDEIEILQNKYSNISIDEINKYLPDRSRNSIILKAISLGLKSKSVLESHFNEYEEMFVLENYKTMTDKELSVYINRSESAINNYRFRNNLIKTHETTSYNDLSEYVRKNNLDWKKESMKNCDYKCYFTGGRFDDIHHIYGLNLILDEAMKELNINIKMNFNDYSPDELRLILNTFRQKQSNYPLGICLSKQIHVQFHNKYGYGFNTIDQWTEFVKDFKLGKYKNVE